MFRPILPPPGIDIPVGVLEGALAMATPVLPEPVVSAMLLIGHLPKPVLEVVLKFSDVFEAVFVVISTLASADLVLGVDWFTPSRKSPE